MRNLKAELARDRESDAIGEKEDVAIGILEDEDFFSGSAKGGAAIRE